MTISQNIINQALMINASTDLVSHVDRERQSTHIATVQLFVRLNETRASRLHTVYLGSTGELMQYDLAPFRIHNAVSNTASYRNRLMYMQVPMDNKEAVNDEGKRIVRNSNPFEFDQLMAPSLVSPNTQRTYNNPFNSVIVSGILRLAVVPSVHNDPETIKTFNEASYKCRRLHALMKEKMPGMDLGSNAEYRKAMEGMYQEYLQTMIALVKSGRLSVTQVISAADNSLVPAVTCDSTMNLDNPFFNSVDHLTSKISYTPTINQFYGSVVVDASATKDDINPDIELGLRSLGKDDETTEEVLSSRSKRNVATLAGKASDTFGNQVSLLVTRHDVGYISPRNPNAVGLAQTFMDVAKNNSNLFVMGKLAPMVSKQDAGGSANGLLRMTVVVNDYASNRVASMNGSVEASALDSLASSDEELLAGVDFANLQANNQVDESKKSDSSNLDNLFDEAALDSLHNASSVTAEVNEPQVEKKAEAKAIKSSAVPNKNSIL